jgi:hydrogenase nickel incorporation protein HypA/HybF
MHEISIAESIVQIAEAKAREQNARSIQVIKLRLGTFTTIVPDALQFAFEICRQGTLSRDARLDIEIVPMVVRCVVCEASTQPVRRRMPYLRTMRLSAGDRLRRRASDRVHRSGFREGGSPWSQYQNEFQSRPMC